MHLWGVNFVQMVLSFSLSINLARAALDLTNQPSVIYVDASFQPVPESNVAVQLQIANHNEKIVNILKRNSILEDSPVADLPLFVMSKGNLDLRLNSVRIH